MYWLLSVYFQMEDAFITGYLYEVDRSLSSVDTSSIDRYSYSLSIRVPSSLS